MRRKDREVTRFSEKLDIMRRCSVCRLAFSDGEYPYIVPLNFGIVCEQEEIALYFHSAGTGKKIDLAKKHAKASFEMDCSHQIVMKEEAASCTMLYESIIGKGTLQLVEGEEKIKGLNALMKQYYKDRQFEFPSDLVKQTTVLKLTVTEWTGKRNLGK